MSLTVRIEKRDFSGILLQPDVVFSINRYSHRSNFGPFRASITAYGTKENLWDLANMLRCPIFIDTVEGDPVWWGYINEVNIRVGANSVGLSLDKMANKVRTAYTYLNERKTTDWTSDTESQNEYGTKEFTQAESDINATLATKKRDEILSYRKYPTAMLTPSPGKVEGSFSAEIICFGWSDVFKWRYWAETKGKEEYATKGTGEAYIFGDYSPTVAAAASAAQSFTQSSGSDWSASSIFVRMRKTSDSLIANSCLITVRVHSDSSGSISTSLAGATASASAGDLTTNMAWVEFQLDSTASLTSGCQYWLVFSSGSTWDGTDNSIPSTWGYLVDVNEDLGYTTGSFQFYNTADGYDAWQSKNPNVDMLFRVIGSTETTSQIQKMAEGTGGSFISGIDIIVSSSIYANEYRDGETTTYTELKALLEGGTTNGRRLQARIFPNRRMVVDEEAAPTSGSDTFYLKADGIIENQAGTQIDERFCPIGYWLELKDIIPNTATLSRINSPATMFVEEAEYDAQHGGLFIYPRDANNPFSRDEEQ